MGLGIIRGNLVHKAFQYWAPKAFWQSPCPSTVMSMLQIIHGGIMICIKIDVINVSDLCQFMVLKITRTSTIVIQSIIEDYNIAAQYSWAILSRTSSGGVTVLTLLSGNSWRSDIDTFHVLLLQHESETETSQSEEKKNRSGVERF